MKNRLDLLTQEQIDWCNEHCEFDWFVKDDGKVYSKKNEIEFKNKNSLVLFLVTFGDCKIFDCFKCELLKSLEGASEKVDGYFDCSYCKLLESFKGVPENVSGDFNCSYCISLRSLKGTPKNVGGFFSCSNCDSLRSLEGVSNNVCGNFYCFNCKSLESIEELKNTKIEEKIYHNGCPKIEKYSSILSDMNVFKMWQKSDLTADEFLKEYDGFIEAQKYGI